MTVAMILGLIKMGQEMIAWGLLQASLAQQNGTLTPAQLTKIKAAAAVSDANWDAEVAAAKERIGAP